MISNKSLFLSTPPYLTALFAQCEYPWQVLDKLSGYINELMSSPPEGFTEYAPGVFIGEGVKIAECVSISAPAIIGKNTEIRHGAFLRGGIITGEGCVIGNSTEIKNSVLLDRVQIPHYNYVGDSILGNGAHLGAGAVLSNLKADGKIVAVHADKDYKTGRRKLGAILADGANVGCGAVLNPGTVICRDSVVYPLTSVRGVICADSIVKSMDNITKRTTE